MSKIYKNDSGVKFLFFTNYKVMNSNLVNILKEAFPDIKIYISIDMLKEFDEYIKLAIVRNPYDRLLSLFLDKCREHPRKVRKQSRRIWLQDNQAQVLSAAAELYNKKTVIVDPDKEIDISTTTYNRFLDNLAVLESLEFIEFVEITSYLFSLPSMDAHFFPQSRIMTKDGSLVIDKYFKLENISESWDKICSIIGRQIVLAEGVNRTNFEGPDKYKRFYNDGLREKVYELYKEDFENFGYDKEC